LSGVSTPDKGTFRSVFKLKKPEFFYWSKLSKLIFIEGLGGLPCSEIFDFYSYKRLFFSSYPSFNFIGEDFLSIGGWFCGSSLVRTRLS